MTVVHVFIHRGVCAYVDVDVDVDMGVDDTAVDVELDVTFVVSACLDVDAY